MIIRRLTSILSLFMLVAVVALILLLFDAQYYLVRHAEKTTEKVDPGLTELASKELWTSLIG